MKKLLLKIGLKKQNNFLLTLFVGALFIGILIILPTDYEDAVLYRDAERAVCQVKDKMYEVGDRALVTISHDGDRITSAVMSDYFRLDKEVILLVLFAVLLIGVGFMDGINGRG